ncbi:MAG: acyltransferase family protein [Rhizobiaceae bacterium]
MKPAKTQENTFNLIRFLAATSVMFSHQFALAGRGEPNAILFNDTVGGAAVSIFFLVSGYLIYQSLERCSDWNVYFAARAVRILPNLAFALIVSSIAFLFLYQNYKNCWAHFRYVTHNIFMFFIDVEYHIPGILDGRPNTSVNGSLWSLPYEFWMYVLLFSIFLLKRWLRIVVLVMLLAVFFSIWKGSHFDDEHHFLGLTIRSIFLGKLGLYFFSGSIVAVLWDRIESYKPWMIAVGLLCICFLDRQNPLFVFSISAIVILIGSSRAGAWFAKGGDASYGIYIFAFPVQQICLLEIGDFWLSFGIALLATVSIGYFCWHTFEKRCLRHKRRVAGWLKWPLAEEDALHVSNAKS